MSYTERVIGDPKGITRRDLIAGVGTVVVSAILASAIGGIAVTSYEAAKKYIQKRIAVLYANDVARPVRVSHQNTEILDLYETFLSPGGVVPSRTELSHRLCHTTYGNKVDAHIAELKRTSVEEAERETRAFMKEELAKGAK